MKTEIERRNRVSVSSRPRWPRNSGDREKQSRKRRKIYATVLYFADK